MSAVLYEVHEGVATLTLNRPQALNSLETTMARGLIQAARQAEFDPAVRVLVIRGAGKHFMAGGDLKWFREQLALPPEQRQPFFEQLLAELHMAILHFKRMGKPVVASVQGAVAGFGLSLMLAADLVVAADDAYFTMAYCHIGLSPDGGATWALPRMLGLKQAMEIALLGDRFDAARALELGLVNRVVPAAALAEETASLVGRLLAGPPQALARTKALLNQSLDNSLEAQLHAEQRAFAASGAEPDHAEGLNAFFEKRKPAFGKG